MATFFPSMTGASRVKIGPMCNACGFYCCAYDGFSGCGCEGCPDPRCWPEDEGDDYDPSDCACGYCGTGAFRCEAVEGGSPPNEAKP